MASDSGHPIRGTTPFPNFLLDRAMPRLRDTEWRLLCVIVRQSFGWSLNGERKKVDWLSHYQLKRKTGRESAAVSRAIEVLVRSGLIVVCDQQGNLLESPAARRRSHARMSFGVNPAFTSVEFQALFAQARFRTSKGENDKRNIYKTKQQHRQAKLNLVGSID